MQLKFPLFQPQFLHTMKILLTPRKNKSTISITEIALRTLEVA